MQDSSAFQFLAIDTIHESTTNPRQTYEQSKLEELAQSIRQHGLIQPITVRPNDGRLRDRRGGTSLPCSAACRSLLASRPYRRA